MLAESAASILPTARKGRRRRPRVSSVGQTLRDAVIRSEDRPVGPARSRSHREPVAGGRGVGLGFSLVEMLVSTAIVTVLVALALPVLSSVRGSVREQQCVWNVRSINLAMGLHAEDWEGRYVGQTTRGDDSLVYLLEGGYLSDPGVALCPNTLNRVDPAQPARGGEPGDDGERWRYLRYAARHARDDTGGHSYETFHHFNEGQFPHASFNASRLIVRDDIVPPWQTFIVLDADNDPSHGGYNGAGYGYNNLPDRSTNNHGNTGMSLAFLDGNARFLPAREWIEVNLYSAHLDGYNTDMVRAKRLFEPRLQWGLRTDLPPTPPAASSGTDRPGLKYWLD